MGLGCGSAAEKPFGYGLNGGFDIFPMADSKGVENKAMFDRNNVRLEAHAHEDRVAIRDCGGKVRQPSQASSRPADRETVCCWG